MTAFVYGRFLPGLALLVWLVSPIPSWAHKASDSFIYIDQTQSTMSTIRVDLALRDLALLVTLDRDRDGQVTGAEFRQTRDGFDQVLGRHFSVANSSGLCLLQPETWGLSQHSDGPYAAASYQVACPNNKAPSSLNYTLLFDQDSLHRGLVSVKDNYGERLDVIAPDATHVSLENSSGPAGQSVRLFSTFLYQGVVHLMIGLDHILFLLVLILPATLPYASRPGFSNASLRSRLLDLVGIVTAFTVAHSITLALAAFNIVSLPIAWVETVIALSIVIAAINVLWPILGRKTWKLAFGFGLIHGFGFASVLGDLTSGVSQTAIALAGFNLGVELGQLLLVLALFPMLYFLSRYSLYTRAAVPTLLMVVGVVSLYWVVDRIPVI